MSLIYFYQSCKLEWLFTFTMHILCYSQLYFFHDAIIKTTRGICLISQLTTTTTRYICLFSIGENVVFSNHYFALNPKSKFEPQDS
jgi:hypothetical protein